MKNWLISKWFVICIAVLVLSGYIVNFSFNLMNKESDSAYVGGIAILVIWIVVLLKVLTYLYNQIVDFCNKIQDEKLKGLQKENEKSSAASASVGPTNVSGGVHN